MKLFKTTLVIWTDYDPTDVRMSDLARDAESGDSYCSVNKMELIEDVQKDPHWDGTEFFGEEEGSDDLGIPHLSCAIKQHSTGKHCDRDPSHVVKIDGGEEMMLCDQCYESACRGLYGDVSVVPVRKIAPKTKRSTGLAHFPKQFLRDTTDIPNLTPNAPL